MGIKKHIAFLVIALMLAIIPVFSQNTDFVIEKINGKKYYMHYVEKGHTLYSISKKYNTTIEVIKENNPEVVSEGLKPGMLLKIPFKKANPLENIQPENQKSCENCSIHEVKPKETLYSISKQYQTAIEIIIEYNPQVQTLGLQPGMKLQIPPHNISVAKKETLPPDKVKGGNIIHIVQPKETLYSIAKRFNVSMQQIAELNHDAIDGLKIGQELLIPITSENKHLAEQIKQAYKQDKKDLKKDHKLKISEETYTDTLLTFSIPDSIKNQPFKDTTYTFDSLKIKNQYTIGVFLPFYCSLNDTLEAKRKPFEPERIYEKSLVALSLYRGLKFAQDSAQKLGLNTKFLIFNTEGSKNNIDSLMQLPVIDSIDVAIGPLFFSCLNRSLSVFREKDIPVFIPIPQSNKILLDNKNAFKLITSDFLKMKKITQYIVRKKKNANILVVNNYEGKYVQLVDVIKEEANKILRADTNSLAADSVKEVFFETLKASIIESELDSTKENVLIVPSVNQVFVSDLLTQLNLLDAYPITVVGMEKWMHWTNIDVDYFHKMHVHIPVSAYFDENRPENIQLIQQYLEKEYTKPNKYDLIGYDLHLFLAHILPLYGTNYSTYSNKKIKGYYLNFNFVKTSPESGYENFNVKILKFHDYRWQQSKD